MYFKNKNLTDPKLLNVMYVYKYEVDTSEINTIKCMSGEFGMCVFNITVHETIQTCHPPTTRTHTQPHSRLVRREKYLGWDACVSMPEE